MPSRFTVKQYNVKIWDEHLKSFLEEQENISEFFRQILDDFRTGKLSYAESQDDIDLQIKQANLTKSTNHNELQSIRKRKLDAETKIVEYHAYSLDTIGSTPSTLAKKAMEHHVNGTTPIDENSIRCPDCANWRSNSKHGIEWQIDALTKHVRNFHNRDFTESEAQELAELIK